MDGVESRPSPAEITSYFNGYPVSNGVMVLLGVEEAQNYYLERVTSGNWGWLRVFNPLINEKTIIGDDAYATAEEVLNTDAQVVILSNADTAATYREAGINVFSVSAGNTIPGFWESIRVTAQLFGGEAEERAEAYIQYAQDTMDMVEERLAERSRGGAPHRLLHRRNHPLYHVARRELHRGVRGGRRRGAVHLRRD